METVRIKVDPHPGNESGIVVINKEDFDPEKHQLADAPKSTKTAGSSKINFSVQSNAELKALLEKANVAVPDGANRGVLLELCKEHTDAVHAAAAATDQQ